jgi:Capsular polysaccharide biosynthesis protein
MRNLLHGFRNRQGSPEPQAPFWDFHCHLLPAVDDGLRTLEETQAAIMGMKALGYRGAVLTPHVYPSVYDNRPEQLRADFKQLQTQLNDHFKLQLAAEYFADETLLADIEKEDLLYLKLGDSKIVLVEFPALMPSPVGMDVLLRLRQVGYQPVLAHVERYRYVGLEPSLWLPRFAQAGTWLQCDIGSLAGQYGAHPQALARSLLDQHLPTLWGSDLHRVAQLQRYVAPGLVILSKSGQRINAMLDGLDE